MQELTCMQPLEGWAVVPRTDALLPLWTATEEVLE